MPSQSLTRWRTDRSKALDEIEAAHTSVGGTGPGRRYATQQINQAYAVLLSSQFQGYCRDLHSECVDSLVLGVPSARLRRACKAALVRSRRLDQGNPNPGNIGSDFERLGLPFWDDVRTLDSGNKSRQNRLEELNRWRNAIAHQDFDPVVLRGTTLRLAAVRKWRSACDGLATTFDEVMRVHIQGIAGAPPR
jgi:hypothetical protein